MINSRLIQNMFICKVSYANLGEKEACLKKEVDEEVLQVLNVVLAMIGIVNSLLAYVCEKMSFNQCSVIVDVTYYGFINKGGLLVPIFVCEII